MRPFEHFLNEQEVRKATPSKEEIRSLIEDATHRFSYFSKEEPAPENSKYIFENLYESIRQLLDAFLLSEGYKSYSHQASIVFAADKGIITDKDALLLDIMRELRNRSKYYGKEIELVTARSHILEAKRIFSLVSDKLATKQ